MTAGINHYIFLSALLLGLGIITAVSHKNMFRIIAGLVLIFTAGIINIAAFTGIGNFNPEGQIILVLTVLTILITLAIGVSLFLKYYKQSNSAELPEND